MLLAIDPGLDTGWAVFDDDKKLIACGLGQPNALDGAFTRDAVIERPQVYSQRLMKGDPNDLITLAIQVGQYKERLEARGAYVTLVKPHAWKGTMPKDVCNRRVLGRLAAPEMDVLEAIAAPTSKKHNVIDAIGIGLWKLGRL